MTLTAKPAGAPHRGYVDGLWGQVHFRDYPGAGTPLILVHQTPWSSIQFYRAAPILAARGRRVVAMDTPGYGLSDPPPTAPTIADYADNLAAAMTALAVEKAILLGHHTGALIAASLAARHPQQVERLILDNAPSYTADERALRQALAHTPLPIADDGSHLTDRWRFLRAMVDPDMTSHSLHLAVITYFSNSPDGDHGHPAAFAHDVSADVKAITCPTLVLSSRTDSLHAHGRRWLQHRPDWHYAELATGSASVLEHPQAWTQIVADFTG